MVKNSIIFYVGLAILFLDQFTKQLFRILNLNTQGNFIDITYTTNPGSLFSLFAGTNFINVVFILLSLIAIGVLVYLYKDEKNFWRKNSYVIIVSGIIGNLIDRILFGAVIDWINFHFWPIFPAYRSIWLLAAALPWKPAKHTACASSPTTERVPHSA